MGEKLTLHVELRRGMGAPGFLTANSLPGVNEGECAGCLRGWTRLAGGSEVPGRIQRGDQFVLDD